MLQDTKTRLLFYNDVAVFGGHEVMTLNAVEFLLQADEYTIVFVYSSRNALLEERLKELQRRHPDLVLEDSAYTSGKLQFLRTSVAVRPLRRIRSLIRSYNPVCAIIIQGDIDNSSLGVVAAARELVYTVSYIPLAHTRRQRRERYAFIKDAALRKYYRLPSSFITITDGIASMLRARGVIQPIDVVNNGINLSPLQQIRKATAKAQLGISGSTYVAAMCGRIEFKQKGHDVFLQALKDSGTQFAEWTFLIAGDGPDLGRLQSMIAAMSLDGKIHLLPWQQDMSLVYSAIDMLVLPSRFEGLPVTMLEAMYFGLPVVASACDAMAELLPRAWLFPPDDSNALAQTMSRVQAGDNAYWLASNRELVVQRFSLDRQRSEFALAIRQCVDRAQAIAASGARL